MNNTTVLCHAIGLHLNWDQSETSASLAALLITAASLGLLHTLFGPDHYLPFIMMSWARKWSTAKTFVVTFICGIGHIIGSVVLGLVGVAMGLGVSKVKGFESGRGDIAAWLLIAFGLAYFVWGVRQAWRKKEHTHRHFHIDVDLHEHEHKHTHEGGHIHVHDKGKKIPITPWVLFVIFAFGPCEVLIPVLMYPAAKASIGGLFLVTGVFALATIGTMLVVVMLARSGINLLPMNKLNRYAHALSGAAILMCGVAIVFLGL